MGMKPAGGTTMTMKSGKWQLFSFIVISYGYLWLLFGIGKLLDESFEWLE